MYRGTVWKNEMGKRWGWGWWTYRRRVDWDRGEVGGSTTSRVKTTNLRWPGRKNNNDNNNVGGNHPYLQLRRWFDVFELQVFKDALLAAYNIQPQNTARDQKCLIFDGGKPEDPEKPWHRREPTQTPFSWESNQKFNIPVTWTHILWLGHQNLSSVPR